MKLLLIIINFIALILTFFWIRDSAYSFEPIIVFITLIGTILTQIFMSNKNSNLNKAKVIGNENIVTQTNKSNKNSNNKNEIQLKGNKNNINQNNNQ